MPWLLNLHRLGMHEVTHLAWVSEWVSNVSACNPEVVGMFLEKERKKNLYHFMSTFMFFMVLFAPLHNIAKHWCPSVIAQSWPSDNKQFDSVRFNSSSQIAHICLSPSKGTLKRQPQIFLAHGLHARAYGSTRSSLGPRGQEGEWAFLCWSQISFWQPRS